MSKGDRGEKASSKGVGQAARQTGKLRQIGKLGQTGKLR